MARENVHSSVVMGLHRPRAGEAAPLLAVTDSWRVGSGHMNLWFQGLFGEREGHGLQASCFRSGTGAGKGFGPYIPSLYSQETGGRPGVRGNPGTLWVYDILFTRREPTWRKSIRSRLDRWREIGRGRRTM